MKKCVCISCFDHYATRMQLICDYFMGKDIEVKYLYADFDHFKKQHNDNIYDFGVSIKVTEYEKNLSPQRIFSHIIFTKRVINFIEEYSPDIIYCMFPPNSLVKAIALYKSKHSNVKLVFDCYDMWPESFPYSKYETLLKLPFNIWGSLRKRYISYADLIICVAENGKQDLLTEVKGKPIEIVRPMIKDSRMSEYNADNSILSICYLGMVNHITDIDLGVFLLQEIAKYKEVVLHIIGEGQNLDEFVDRLEAVGVDVVCHGCVFDIAEKNSIFSLCNMGINIPREEINSTMSLKAIEYLRAGLPFINSALGDIKKIVVNEKVGINVDKEHLEKTIEEICNMSSDGLLELHFNAVEAYDKYFRLQNLDDIFSKIVE